MSSAHTIWANEHYLEIIKLGQTEHKQEVIDFIVEDIKTNGADHWDDALRKIIGDSPFIPEKSYGRIREICDIWVKWITPEKINLSNDIGNDII